MRSLAEVDWRDALARHGPFARYLVAHVAIAASIRFVAPIVTLYYVRGVHATDAEIGLIVTAGSVATYAAYHGWRGLARGVGGRRVLLSSAALTAGYPIALGLSPNPLLAGVVTAIGAIGSAGLSLALFDELMRRVPSTRAMVFTSADFAAANAAGIVAPLAGALLADAAGLPVALGAGGAIGLVGVGLFALDGRLRLPAPLQHTVRANARPSAP